MKTRAELLLSAAPLAWLTLFFLLPSLLVFTIAFRPVGIFGGIAEGWTWASIAACFTASTFKLLCRTLVVATSATVLCVLIAIPVAYAIIRFPERWRQSLLALCILPFWTSFVVRIFAWKALLHPEGFLKYILVAFGLVESNSSLLYNNTAVILVIVYTYLPLALLPVYGSAERCDFRLMEAACDLGMTTRQAFFRIFIPSIRSGVYNAALLLFIPILGMYVIPDVIGGPGTELLGNRIVQRIFVDRNVPQAAALTLLMVLTAMLPLLLFRSLQRKGGHDET
jgi:spermidine/putrescine transport system permease protein